MYYFADTNLSKVPIHLLEDSSNAIAITYTYRVAGNGYIYQKISPHDDMRFVVAFLNPEPEIHTYLKLLNIRLVKVEEPKFIGMLNELFAAKEYEEIYD